MCPIRRKLIGTILTVSVAGCTGPYVRSERIAFERAQTLIETMRNPCIDEYSRLSFEQYGEKVVIQKGGFLEDTKGLLQFMGTSVDAKGMFAEFRFTTDITGPFVLMMSTNVVTCGTPLPSVIIIRSERE